MRTFDQAQAGGVVNMIKHEPPQAQYKVIKDSPVKAEILQTFDTLRADRSHPVFAVESGSRAWGFESRDSDYDIRFVYSSPLSYYLTIHPGRDVIENGDVNHPNPLLDFSGWDIRKFLRLVAKSNPVCFEWMRSEMMYLQDYRWGYIKQVCAPFFSPRAAIHHYLSMARHNYREHMRDGQSPKVRLKKYLYITRPLLCCRWIERDIANNSTHSAPPMPFEQVLEVGLSDEVRTALLDLVARKKQGDELDEGPAIACINSFIDNELQRLPEVAKAAPDGQNDTRVLDQLLYDIVCK